jgi:hypothetical protein
MALLQHDGNEHKVLEGTDFTSSGELKTREDTTALVVGFAEKSETWIASKQWNLMWRDADLLFQAPRPMSVVENTYVLEPNVQRFTVAKVVNSVVPQLYKGLFFENPPMVLRPRPGTSQKITDDKTVIISYLLDACQFKREVKWGLECLAHLGTGIWKWGIERVEKEIPRRVSTDVSIDPGKGAPPEKISADEPPKIETVKKICSKPFFEFRPIQRVLVSPNLKVGDIRESDEVADVRYMDFYQLQDLKKANSVDGKPMEGWTWDEYYSDEKLKELWNPPVEGFETPGPLRTDVQAQTTGVVHHGEEDTFVNSADPLAKKLEVLEYWTKRRKIIVLNRKKTIFSGENPFRKIPFLSANWWNRPKAFYGMGIGLTVGQNQRVDQGTINSILKVLSFAVNPAYVRTRDSNAPTQMIRTGIGKIITVDGIASEAFHLLETPKVPPDTWAALQNSEANTESTTGADQSLVQGSTAGPRTGMGRSAAGANALANASATRLDGPLDNFIDQVFTPFLYILDELVFYYMSDQEIQDILGEEKGKDYRTDLQQFHDGKIEFEVLASSSLAAKRTMAQSLTLITQFMQNPGFNEYLADLGLYIDWETIFDMWLMASEWKNGQDIIKHLTPEMEQRRQAKLQQQQQGPLQTQMAINNQKAQDKSALEDQRSANKIKNDLVRFATLHSAESEATEGEPGNTGFGDIEGM